MNTVPQDHRPEDGKLVYDPLDWHRVGDHETSSGYGSNLTTPFKARIQGKLRRVYAYCWSNIASHFVRIKGRKVWIDTTAVEIDDRKMTSEARRSRRWSNGPTYSLGRKLT